MSLILQIAKSNNLQLKLKKIKIMKWILDLEKHDIDISEAELQKQIDQIAYKNFTFIPVLISHFEKLPQIMRNAFDKLVYCKDKSSYDQVYRQFLKDLEQNNEYQEYNMYLLTDIARYSINSTVSMDIDYLSELFMKTKQIYYVLVYNIVSGLFQEQFRYNMEEIIYTYPLLYKWVKENKYKSLETLTDDDCEVIAGLFYGLKPKEMLELNLRASNQSVETIKLIIQQLPKKFHVENVTQVIFRALLLKPFLWSLPRHEYIALAIKGLKYVLPQD